jgi:hypothetical protein
MRPRKLVPVAAGLTMLLAAACSSGGSSTDTGAPAPKASGAALDLKSVCPATVVIQTDWFPESEYGGLYNLVGPGYSVDKGKKKVVGALVSKGQDTGVKVEVRSGGEVIGGQQVSTYMYSDKSVTLGMVSTDEQIQNSAKQPTVAVIAPLEISPIMIMWDKSKHPDFNTIADLGQTNTKILYFSTDTYMQYLLGAGLVRPSQLDGSYTGAPDQWIAAKGEAAQGGFATSEPFLYGKGIATGGKTYDIDFQLVNDTGYPVYGQALTIRPEDKQQLGPCLQKLVPIIQQSVVDFIESPDRANKLIIDAVKQYGTFWTYDEQIAGYTSKTMRDLGLVSNGPDKTLGNMQEQRVRRMIDILTPVFAAQRKPVKDGIKATDLFTNEYLDSSIGLKSS